MLFLLTSVSHAAPKPTTSIVKRTIYGLSAPAFILSTGAVELSRIEILFIHSSRVFIVKEILFVCLLHHLRKVKVFFPHFHFEYVIRFCSAKRIYNDRPK